MKKLIWVICLLLPVLLYAGIVKWNDSIADGLKRTLTEYPLPPQTELLDSKAIAGKQNGNGNGMQYFGLLLVSSDLTAEQLQAHYGAGVGDEGFLLVEPQESQRIDGYGDYWFDAWESDRPCYRIELSMDSVSGCEESILEALLNCDLRGH